MPVSLIIRDFTPLTAGWILFCSLIARFAHISPGNTQTPDSTDLQLTRYSNSDNALHRKSRVGSAMRVWFHKSRFGQLLLLFLALLGTSLVLGDSVLTPAQSGELFPGCSAQNLGC